MTTLNLSYGSSDKTNETPKETYRLSNETIPFRLAISEKSIKVPQTLQVWIYIIVDQNQRN